MYMLHILSHIKSHKKNPMCQCRYNLRANPKLCKLKMTNQYKLRPPRGNGWYSCVSNSATISPLIGGSTTSIPHVGDSTTVFHLVDGTSTTNIPHVGGTCSVGEIGPCTHTHFDDLVFTYTIHMVIIFVIF